MHNTAFTLYTVIVNIMTFFTAGAPTTVVTTVVPLGSQSTHMICPHCHAEVDTTTKTSPSLVAWLSGFIICILGYVT